MASTAIDIGFTPGPWAAREKSPNWEIFGDAECRWVAYAPKAVSDELRDGTFYPSLSETRANANLISAAPELLDCLEALVEIADDQLGGDFPETMIAARAAIRKALGK